MIRSNLKTSIALATIAVSGTVSAQPTTAPSAPARRPNVVLIVADDLGYADLGCQGQSKDVRTPNIDALAAAGVRFTSGYVSCPVCSPSRAGLLTGRYQERFGHELNPGPQTPPQFGLPLDQITLPQILRDAGYTTGIIGKWHLGYEPQHHPLRRGFDEFFGFVGGSHDYNDPKAGKGPIERNNGELVNERSYLTDALGREAVSFIDRRAAEPAKPFFLYLAFNAVHTPMQAPKSYTDAFSDTSIRKRRTMLGMLSAMDSAVGKVADALRRHDIDRDTLVIFISDNGGPTWHNSSRNEPLRGIKATTWEGGIRVPFIMRWTGRLPEQKVEDRPVIALDLFSTVLAAAGAPAPADRPVDGVDLMPFLAGGNTADPHDALFWRFGLQWAVRAGNYKLTVAPDLTPGAEKEPTKETPPQLFDLSKDIGEQHDLAAEHPEIVTQLRGRYDAWSKQMIAPLWTAEGASEWRAGTRAGRAAATTQAAEEP